MMFNHILVQCEIQYYEIDQKTHSIIEQFSHIHVHYYAEPVFNHNFLSICVFCVYHMDFSNLMSFFCYIMNSEVKRILDFTSCVVHFSIIQNVQ